MLKKICGLLLAACCWGMTYQAEAVVIDKRPVIIGVSYLSNNDITRAMLNSIKTTAKKLNAKLILRDGRGDADVQIAQIHDLLAQKTGALVVIFDKAAAAGRTVENSDTGIPVRVVDGTLTDRKTAETAAAQATEEVWHKVKDKPVKPAFYNGY